LAKLAVILHQGSLGTAEERLGRILDFFGVPWKAVAVAELEKMDSSAGEHAALGSVQAVAAARARLAGGGGALHAFTAVYAYLDPDDCRSETCIREIYGRADWSLGRAPGQRVPVVVSTEERELTGPMSGLKLNLELGTEDAFLAGDFSGPESAGSTILSAAGHPAFHRSRIHGTKMFLCMSAGMVDIDQAAGSGFYDVKQHFCSVAPLVMFIKSAFREVAWRQQELGACLIIDDPLLKPRYGFCDFPKLQALMQGHGFNTNISFIPWNWRRTTPAAAEFFKSQEALFSVSIHGCDHIASEFGAASAEVLNDRARLAQARMRKHETRTGIRHDPVMVFPQGVFSSACPEILKRNGFLAAVNTETLPVDSQNARTRIRDVWDVAITSYGGFPVFTRRYAFHGLENFAFDLLLGKPCLIVSHHDFFKDGGAGLIALIDQLSSLNCSLRWRSLGEVVRRACRRRWIGPSREEIEMYGTELRVENPSDRPIEARVRKRESRADQVAEVLCGEMPVTWTAEGEHLCFGGRIPPHSEEFFKVCYRSPAHAEPMPRSLRYEITVAARRVLSEWRDDYLCRSHFLSATAAKLKGALRRHP